MEDELPATAAHVSQVDATFFDHIGEDNVVDTFTDSEDEEDTDTDTGYKDDEIEYSSDHSDSEGEDLRGDR